MNQSTSSFFLMLVFAAGTLLAAGTPAPSFNPHSISVGEYRPECRSCHAGFKPAASTVNMSLAPTTVGDGIGTCITCHESAAVQHMVGARPDFKVPNYLPLDAQGRITCLTCHYTHGALRSEKPWANVNWFERLVHSERLHKTYLLRRNNTDGGLCMECHDS